MVYKRWRFVELWTAEGNIFTGDQYNKIFTLHGAIAVFVHHPVGTRRDGQLLTTIDAGAKDVAFPRLNLASWYIYVAGSLFLVTRSAGSIILGGPSTRRTVSAPLIMQTRLLWLLWASLSWASARF